MKLLYGTGNPAKAAAMQNRIAGLGIELIRKRMLIMKLFVCLYFPVIPGCILKMSRRRSSLGYMCVR